MDGVIALGEAGETVQAAARSRRSGKLRGAVGGPKLDVDTVNASFSAVERAILIGIAPNQVAEGLGVEAKVNGHVGAGVGLVALTNNRLEVTFTCGLGVPCGTEDDVWASPHH